MTMFGSLMFLPVFVQGVLGLNATNSGWVMTPMMAGFMIGAIVTGQVMSKTGRYKYLAWISGAIVIVGSLLLNQMNIHTTMDDSFNQYDCTWFRDWFLDASNEYGGSKCISL